MLPLAHRIAFLLFAGFTGILGARGFFGVYRKIRRGRVDSESRTAHPLKRLRYTLLTTLLQSRTFRNRPVVSLLHAFIFYGFVYYLLVNLVDAAEGYWPATISSASWPGATYNLLADVLSGLVLVGVLALVARRFLFPSRRDFSFNPSVLVHPNVARNFISRDSLIVSIFILVHVGSRALGAAAKVIIEGRDPFQPFAAFLAHAITPAHAETLRIFSYWGALGSILAFLMYFPYSKHIHTFFAPINYLFAREAGSGVLPPLDVNLDSVAATDTPPVLGAATLEDLGWPRLLDAYACIQCNRCQEVCPASLTGKALSPAALEINKRMELNTLAPGQPASRPLLEFALSPAAAWACTTCGACMHACPVQNEQMLDLIDIRRNQVMIEGEFPVQLQSAFRGMERAGNPWGIQHDQRMAWADGLSVPTIDDNPNPDLLYWVGCAPSYDPQSQKTSRALVRLLQHAGVNFAVLGKRESCTGDSARRAGNEYLYHQLARQNIATLNAVKPRLIVTTCPHCMNTIGNEYPQLGGHYKVIHHTELLASLVVAGKLDAQPSAASITYHDPCYLGRHNGVYDAPRNLLRVLSNDFVELPRNCENSFCCGAGGTQFWKEEESGLEKISSNRFREVRDTLAAQGGDKVLAVGCPFCKTMLGATPEKAESSIEIRDVAELLLEGVLKKSEINPALVSLPSVNPSIESAPDAAIAIEAAPTQSEPSPVSTPWVPSAKPPLALGLPPQRMKWSPKPSATLAVDDKSREAVAAQFTPPAELPATPAPFRRKWTPGSNQHTETPISLSK
jgi:Fe-S oxidoreductase